MPKRFLKPGLTTSDNWNSCGWHAQSFYVRLITLADDYGRYDGRFSILKSHAFPLHPKIKESEVKDLCQELVKNHLVTLYVKGDKIIIQLLRWEEKARSEPRYPAFDNNCKQLFADDSNCVPPSSSPTPSTSSSPTPTDDLGLVFPQVLRTEAFMEKWAKWVEFRKTLKRVKDWVAFFQENLDWLGQFPHDTALAMVSQSLRNRWQGIFEIKHANTHQQSTGIGRTSTARQRNAGISGAERIRDEIERDAASAGPHGETPDFLADEEPKV